VKRRKFITLLSGAAAWPLVARAQPAMPVIGFLGAQSPSLSAGRLNAFQSGLKENGFVEGQNVAIEYRWAEGHNDRLLALAAELVRRQVNVITTIDGIPSAVAAKKATTTIPIVFRMGADPVVFGLVTSLNRPGRNITGVSSLNIEVGPKRLELLHEVVPTATVVALLVNPTNPNFEMLSQSHQVAARALGLQLHVVNASVERDIHAVFSTLTQLRAGGLVIGPDVFFSSMSNRLAALSLRHAVPAIYQWRDFAASGGLMSYGADLADSSRQAGVYTARILKGEKPADLPVQQSTKVELIINLKTARALGLTIPLPLLGRADEVIE
jgi:putative tryptophan/tyrosine transport system substrate-binding protein